MTEQFKPNPAIQPDEKLEELDAEVTDRLARALDRFQMAQPYQNLTGRRSAAKTDQSASSALPELTPEQRAMREAFVTQELSALLSLAGKLNQTYNLSQPKATPDRHYRDSLKEELRQMARD